MAASHLNRGLMATFTLLAALWSPAPAAGAAAGEVLIRDVARVASEHPLPLTGYGIVTGLAGTGDSSRNKATLQSIANVIARFGVRLDAAGVSSRNVAAVVVSASLPAYSEAGHALDVQVSSLGDARSLTGGVLLLTPLYGPDEQLYALAKGSVVVGGHQFEAPGASHQRNFPTAGHISDGAIVERAALDSGADPSSAGSIDILLDTPDYGTAQQIAEAVNLQHPQWFADPISPGKVRVTFEQAKRVSVAAALERTTLAANASAKVVVNERTGTVVSGGGVRLGAVTVSHGDLQVEIRTRFNVSQPGGFLVRPGPGVETLAVPESEIDVAQSQANLVAVQEGASVGELVSSLRGLRLSTRDVIAILQSIKAAGALHGELIIQ